MSEVAIAVENLGKKYRIRHQAGRGQTNLREALSQGVSRLLEMKPGPADRVEEFWALRNVNFETRRGDVLGIIGRNGAGKSTFLKLLSRITEPSTGSIEFSGRIASLLEVGTGFHPELSGRENIFLNGAILGMHRTEIRRKFDDIVNFAGVEQFLDTPVKHYSSGMYMRLAFAVAAHLDTDILLVDEVLAVGDADFQKKCIGKMHEVAQEHGRTVIFVSHNMPAVKSLCNRTLHLERGNVVAYGPTEEVLSSYLAKGSSNSGKWISEDPRPAHPDIQLMSVEMEDSEGASGMTYFSSRDLIVTTTFRLSTTMPSLCVGFDIVTADGAIAFRCYHTDQPENLWLRQRVGINRWTCRIPAGLLNGGTYYVSPRIALHNVKGLIMLDAVIQFEVMLSHGVSPFWNRERPGCVAPIMPWSAQEI